MKKLIYILLFLVLCSIAHAVPPFTAQEDVQITEGLVIDYPLLLYYPANQEIGLSFHVFNQSNGVIFGNSSVDCWAHVQNSTGQTIYSIEDINTTNYDENFYASNTGGFDVGYYGWIMHCNHTSQNLGGYVHGNFEITSTGKENILESTPLGYLVVVLSILSVALVLFIFAFKLEDEHFILKLIMIFSSISMLILIPAFLVSNNFNVIFYKLTLNTYRLFWVYVGIYFIYWILKKMGYIVDDREREEEND